MALDDFLVDKRVVERHLKDGQLDRVEYQRLLDGLPDRSANIWKKPISTEAPERSDDSAASLDSFASP